MYFTILHEGMQKLTQFSEGVRESLRRLSSVTWMAEELLKVADYYMPNKWVSFLFYFSDDFTPGNSLISSFFTADILCTHASFGGKL